MIKGISILHPARSADEFDELSGFFLALGLEPGKGWNTEESRGNSFLAPLGNVEFTFGKSPSTANLFIEVTSVDSIHQTVAAWLKTHHKPAPAGIESTDWQSQIFTVSPVDGFAVTFWSWLDPLKGKPLAVEGDLSAVGMKFAIVTARWNAVITDRLLEGALDALLRSGAKREDIQIVRVPGAWEIPAAARTLANLGKVDAILTLGCLLRGETAHYEAIYTEVARGIGQSQQETGIPHAFGVLTCETLEQALNRAGIKAGNKGFEAGIAAIEMVSINRQLKGQFKGEFHAQVER